MIKFWILMYFQIAPIISTYDINYTVYKVTSCHHTVSMSLAGVPKYEVYARKEELLKRFNFLGIEEQQTARIFYGDEFTVFPKKTYSLKYNLKKKLK